MTKRAMIFLPALLLVGCSDDGSSATDSTVSDGPVSTAEASLDASADTSAADQSTATGKATDLKLGLHDNLVKVVLSTMTVVGKEATEWDFYITHGDPVDQLPHIELGAGVTAQNLGNTKTFHEVDTAPTDGYTADDPSAQTYVIGSSWRDGGSGTTGFTMTKNIYALKLADGTYAKIEVLSAKGGEVHILAYRQPTPGDTDLATTP